ncbi:mRNA splicing protein PRP28 Ecym_1395 [Eremothecium cymbalariae DBVPG|uniref:RNA helicase n=1 Tax=Eremothecium cymbalariae (strain CBS 270.75 / DBVPG 7215 / KCTC 17166 / NRRL Y-17582) TaxID=931890 RepID=G8JM54_ERECY|nr:hypothetical protein Ecym_1395 [Eremothecium cymbalariae DBVPG\
MRPLDIHQLLSNSKDSKGRITKPRFLDKEKRLVLAAERRNKEFNSADRVRDKKVRVLVEPEEQIIDQASSRQVKGVERVSRSKFNFDWNEKEDTLAEFKPLTKVKVKDVLYRAREGSAVDGYMSKRWTEKKLSEMTERDWRILREDFNITAKGGGMKHPLRNWSELKLIPTDIVKVITDDLGYEEPTPIQRATIPNVQNNRDFMGVASTGSGKTLAFLIPIFMKFTKLPPLNVITRQDGPQALILAPTRELAQQIEAEAKKFCAHWKRPCLVTSIVGGHTLEEIIFNLQDGCNILVATPGRLIDCLENHVLVLKQVYTLVLDEADRMVDFGFEDQLTTILARTDDILEKQTLMFTATMSSSIERIANGYLRNPGFVTIGGSGSAPQIQQIIEYVATDEQRFKMLTQDILPNYRPPVIIFINYKVTADWLLRKFQEESKFRVTILHGSKSQTQREHSLKAFREGKVDIMVATDVAGRGIDIPNVSLVVNFQMPSKLDDYIHRIGRTGRANQKGTTLTFLGDKDDARLVQSLFKFAKKHDVTGTNSISDEAKRQFHIGEDDLKALIY